MRFPKLKWPKKGKPVVISTSKPGLDLGQCPKCNTALRSNCLCHGAQGYTTWLYCPAKGCGYRSIL
jgi:hypothetical protein